MSLKIETAAGWPSASPASTALTVSEIERLAKAGVKFDCGTVQPIPDPLHDKDELDLFVQLNNHLAKAIWYRWLRTKEAMNPNRFMGGYMDGRQPPFLLCATQHGDKVWVSVHPTDNNHEPFQLTDDAIIFPSDALMAKLALWEKDHG